MVNNRGLLFGCCRFFDISPTVLPEIRSSSEVYGNLMDGPLKGLPIAGVCTCLYR